MTTDTFPLNVGFIRSIGIVLNANGIVDMIEEFLGTRLGKLY